jgi:hypothetical protein
MCNICNMIICKHHVEDTQPNTPDTETDVPLGYLPGDYPSDKIEDKKLSNNSCSEVSNDNSAEQNSKDNNVINPGTPPCPSPPPSPTPKPAPRPYPDPDPVINKDESSSNESPLDYVVDQMATEMPSYSQDDVD